MENLATRIRRMREHRNLTQEHVAERLGISVRTYRQLEHKDTDAARLLTLQRLIALSKALDVPPEALLGNEATPDTEKTSAIEDENATLRERLLTVRQEKEVLLGVLERMSKHGPGGGA